VRRRARGQLADGAHVGGREPGAALVAPDRLVPRSGASACATARDDAPLGDRRQEARASNRAARQTSGGRSARLSRRAARIPEALRRRKNWVQLVKFGIVGAWGYLVNLAVYTLLLKDAGLHYVAAATGSFLVAASWNYWWNRTWTFRAQRGDFGIQGMRFFIVSATVYSVNIGVLTALVSSGLGKIVAQTIAIILVTPLNFLANKLWSFRR
jgi:putative flippase GtrA